MKTEYEVLFNAVIPPLRNSEYEVMSDYTYKRVSEYDKRHEFVKLYSFAVPTEECVEAIRKYAPILEVGAGTGYWAYELKKAGINIRPTDVTLLGLNPYGFRKQWTNVESISAVSAIRKYSEYDTLMTVWPCYNDKWSYLALKEFKGSHVIYVGEDSCGCTGTEEFHETLYNDFDVLETIYIPQYDGIHDDMTIYKRK